MEGASIVIWVDPLIDNEENKSYLKELKNFDYLKVKDFKHVENAIDELKKIFFEETFIILSGKLYLYFIEQFKENLKDVYIIPKILVFTSKVNEVIDNIIININNMHNSFFISGGIQNKFSEVKCYLLKKGGKLNIDEGHLTIESIDRKEQLLLPILYKSLIDSIQYDEIINFNEIIYKNYSKESKDISYLLKTIESIPNIPLELLSKYYARIYTAKSNNEDNNFHSNMNKDLRENKHDIYLPYIKVLYAGIKLKVFPLASNKILYRGTFLLNDELEIIKNYIEKGIDGLPGVIIFSKEFLLFYKDKKIVEKKILNINNKDKNLSKVLFILEENKNIDQNSSTHADIENISFYPAEREVLFLPFSSFGIRGIKEIINNNEKIYEIKIFYLIEYSQELIEDSSIINNENIIPNTEFKNQIIQFGLINFKQIKTTKNLAINNIKYKSSKIDYKIKEINNKDINNKEINNKELNNNGINNTDINNTEINNNVINNI